MRATVALVWIRSSERGDESADGGHVVFPIGEPRVRGEIEAAEEVKAFGKEHQNVLRDISLIQSRIRANRDN